MWIYCWINHMFLLIVVVGLLPQLQPILGIEIVKHPAKMVVFTGREAEFTCETSSAPFFSWVVNGTYFGQLNSTLRTDLDRDEETVGDNERHILTVQAKAKYNGTVVQCVVSVPGVAFISSENATLLIQGVPAPVGDVSVESANFSILFSWSRPFSLDVTGVDPDIWYSVLISNVTDEDNPTAVPCTDCHNLTEPHYTFTTANPSPCHKYSFTVIPQNGAGNGSISEPVEGTFEDLDAEFDVSSVQSLVTYLNPTAFSVSLDMRLVGGANICSYDFVLYIENETVAYTIEGLPLLSGYKLGFSVSSVVSKLEYNFKYNMTIEGNGMFNTSRTFELSTFDVQDVDTSSTVDDRTIEIFGVFIINSPAKGCFIIVKCSSSSPDRMMAVLNTSTPAVVTGLEPNTYDILVYDVEENGLPNEKPAVKDGYTSVSQGEGSVFRMIESSVLNNVTIYFDGDQVSITCHFKNDSFSSQKCVLVCRKSTESVLIVDNYSEGTDFPVKLNLPEAGIYFVAVFGWSDGMIETLPLDIQQVDIKTDVAVTPMLTPTPTRIPALEPVPSSRNILPLVLVVASAPAFIILVVTVVFVALVVIVIKKKREGNFETHSAEKANTQSAIVLKERAHSSTVVVLDNFLNTEPPSSPDATTCTLSSERDTLVTKNEGKTALSTMHQSDGVGTQYATMSADAALKTLPPVDSLVQYQQIDHNATKRQAHPQHLLYVELGSKPEGLPYKPPPDEPPSQYASILPHAVSHGKGNEMPAQECSDDSGQKSGVVSTTCDWKLYNSNSDGNRGPGVNKGQPGSPEKETTPVCEEKQLKNNKGLVDISEVEGEEHTDTVPLLQCKNGRESMVVGRSFNIRMYQGKY